MRKALVEHRPWLLLSLIFGISYLAITHSAMPGAYQMLWKAAAVGCLVPYALLRHKSLDARLLAAALGLGALGDYLIEISLIYGALSFVAAHCVAIALYFRNRREQVSFSQAALAILLVPLSVAICWNLPADRAAAGQAALYAGFVAAMAAMAWTSRFPRYQTGIGALLFLISDFFLVAMMGPLNGSILPDLLVWPLYYFGQFMIATGVIQTLRRSA